MRSVIRRVTAMAATLAALGATGLFISATPAAAWAAGSNTSDYGPAMVECPNPLNPPQEVDLHSSAPYVVSTLTELR